MSYNKVQAAREFDRWSHGYDRCILQRLLFEPSHRAIIARVRARCGERPLAILDVGCGTGVFASQIRAASPRSTVWGVDLVSAMLAQGKARWKVAMTPDFEQSADFQALNRYHLPLAAPLRSLEAAELFDALAQGGVNMVVTTASDGHLTTPQWKVLQDDKKAFPAQQVCLLVRQDRLAGEPGLRPALEELYGKMTLDAMRKLNHQIEIDHTDVAAVARQFLASVGLR